jgi:tetraacyldisaccharide 4'-kinase
LADALGRVTAVILIGEDRQNLTARLAGKPIIHAKIEARLPENFPAGAKFIAFSGIGRPEKFFATCEAAGLAVVGKHGFADHHFFAESELDELDAEAKAAGARLLTTEKDWVRLPEALRAKVLTLPVVMAFEDEAVVYKTLQI